MGPAPKKSNNEVGFSVCHLAGTQLPERPWLLGLGGAAAPGGAGSAPAVFVYRELLPMGTLTRAASAFAVSIGQGRSQPSDRSRPCPWDVPPGRAAPLPPLGPPLCSPG